MRRANLQIKPESLSPLLDEPLISCTGPVAVYVVDNWDRRWIDMKAGTIYRGMVRLSLQDARALVRELEEAIIEYEANQFAD